MQTVTIESVLERDSYDWLQAFQDSANVRTVYEVTPHQVRFSRMAVRIN